MSKKQKMDRLLNKCLKPLGDAWDDLGEEDRINLALNMIRSITTNATGSLLEGLEERQATPEEFESTMEAAMDGLENVIAAGLKEATETNFIVQIMPDEDGDGGEDDDGDPQPSIDSDAELPEFDAGPAGTC